MKQESLLKSALVRTLKEQLPGFIVLRHEDVRTSGIPDISVTGGGRTSWIEVKHATPHLETRGIQELTCLRLAGAGFCRYLVYQENKRGNGKRTLIVHPKHIGDMLPETFCVGYDHRWVAEYLRKIHG
ncbi:MAG: hypothetical protein NUV51_09460 [Sulfuricaulis sp.]|nr:hypothetical protein [Sulfuricaulis sp.]